MTQEHTIQINVSMIYFREFVKYCIQQRIWFLKQFQDLLRITNLSIKKISFMFILESLCKILGEKHLS